MPPADWASDLKSLASSQSRACAICVRWPSQSWSNRGIRGGTRTRSGQRIQIAMLVSHGMKRLPNMQHASLRQGFLLRFLVIHPSWQFAEQPETKVSRESISTGPWFGRSGNRTSPAGPGRCGRPGRGCIAGRSRPPGHRRDDGFGSRRIGSGHCDTFRRRASSLRNGSPA